MYLNSFVPNASFLYPLKTSENLKFSDIFRRQRKDAVGTNGLNHFISLKSCDVVMSSSTEGEYTFEYTFKGQVLSRLSQQMPSTFPSLFLINQHFFNTYQCSILQTYPIYLSFKSIYQPRASFFPPKFLHLSFSFESHIWSGMDIVMGNIFENILHGLETVPQIQLVFIYQPAAFNQKPTIICLGFLPF